MIFILLKVVIDFSCSKIGSNAYRLKVQDRMGIFFVLFLRWSSALVAQAEVQ